MSIDFKLDAESRSDLGKGASRRLRRTGRVPAIVYGEGTDLSIRLLDVEPDMRKQIYYPDAILYHDYAKSETHLKEKRKKQLKSWERLMRKHPGINSFESKWDVYFQREDLLLLRDPSQGMPKQEVQSLLHTDCLQHIMFVMYGWNDTGGGTIRPRLLAKDLVRLGYRVTVIYAGSTRKAMKPAYYVEKRMDEGVQLFGIFNRPALLCDIENPERELNDPRMCEIVKGIISEQDPDIVHCHNLVGFSLTITEEIRKLNVPAIYTFRNYWPICPRLYLLKEDLSLCEGPSEDGQKCAACVGRFDKKHEFATRLSEARRMLSINITRNITISNRSREILLRNGFNGKNIHVLHQYPETLKWIEQQTNIAEKEKEAISNPLNIGFIGYVLPMKGVHLLAIAAQQFEKEQIAVHIYGEGPSNYISTLKNIDKNNILTFKGGYRPVDLPNILSNLDLVVVPSICEETQGVVVLEAMAAKLPVIGCRIGGITDFIKDGKNGILIEPNNINQLADALRKIIKNPSVLIDLRANIHVPKTTDRYTEDLISHYKEARSEHFAGNRYAVDLVDSPPQKENAKVQPTKTSQHKASYPNQRYSLYHTGGCDESLKRWMAPYADIFSHCKKVLDIGCGLGIFMELLQQRGVDSEGIDTDPEMVAVCRNKGLKANVMDCSQLSDYQEMFDGIHLGHVIEHMDGVSMVKMLEACVRALHPDGLLLIRTPNWQNETVRNEGFWLDHTHVRPYPLPLLVKIYKDLNLEIVQKGFEPNGWNDLYILGKKESLSPDSHDSEMIKSPLIQKNGLRNRIRWEGSQFVHHSLALVNREICISLAGRNNIELSIIPHEKHTFGPEEDPDRFLEIKERLSKPLSGPADFHIRHQWPPDFNAPPEGHWIMIQPWEYGALPKEWIEPMKTSVDELWVPSRYVQNVYLNSGIPSEKVFVIPNGVNVGKFNAQAPALKLNTDKKYKFLFIGGTINRKGIDVLLHAYKSSFSNKDDVCLVIKDMGVDSFYQNQGAERLIEKLKADENSPEILYLTQDLSTQEIAGLYTACNCLVHPYRGEGFGLPVAEAMACGLPVIVTRGGACDDFCTDANAYLIDSKIKQVRVSNFELTAPGTVLEPDLSHLKELMISVFKKPSEATHKGSIAADDIRSRFTWSHAVDKILRRLEVLRSKPILRFKDQVHANALGRNQMNKEETYHVILKHVETGEVDKAYRELEQFIIENPEFATAYNDLGVLCVQKGSHEKAIGYFRKAIELVPENVTFQKNLADTLCLKTGPTGEAIKIYGRVLENRPDDIEALLAMSKINFQKTII